MASGRRVSAAAAALGVHANTVRYRLERYEEAAGLSLAENRHRMELWWCLEWFRMRSAGTTPTA